jgi:hypothetical protein
MLTAVQTRAQELMLGFQTRQPHAAARLRELWPLALALLALVTLWARYPHGFEASDPWVYAHYAHMLRDGSYFAYPDNHPFMQRIGLLLPLAAVELLWGVTPRSSHAVPLLAAAGILICVWYALPDRRSRCFALLIAVTSGPLLSATTNLYPDLLAAALMNVSLLLLFQRSGREPGRLAWYGAAGALFWFSAFLAKESACWALPIWLACACADLRARRWCLLKGFYLPAGLAGLALGGLYLYGSQLVFGDPLARFIGVEAIADQHTWAIRSTEALRSRLLDAPFDLFSEHYGALCVLTLLAPLVMPRELRFWAYSAFFFVFAYWFGSAGLSLYRPLPLYPRMTLPGAPAMYIASGYTMAWLSRNVPIRHGLRWAVALVLLWSIAPLRGYAGSWHRDPEQHAMRRVVREVAQAPTRRVLLVCSDQRSADFLDIYFAFQPPANLAIVSAERLSDEQLSAANVLFFFVHKDRSRFIARKYNLPNYDAELRALRFPRLFSRDGIELYRADGPLPVTKAQLLAPLAAAP